MTPLKEWTTEELAAALRTLAAGPPADGDASRAAGGLVAELFRGERSRLAAVLLATADDAVRPAPARLDNLPTAAAYREAARRVLDLM